MCVYVCTGLRARPHEEKRPKVNKKTLNYYFNKGFFPLNFKSPKFQNKEIFYFFSICKYLGKQNLITKKAPNSGWVRLGEYTDKACGLVPALHATVSVGDQYQFWTRGMSKELTHRISNAVRHSVPANRAHH